MHTREGFMLLEALIALSIFALVVSLFFFFVFMEKPSIFSPTSMQKLHSQSSQSHTIRSGNITLEIKMGECTMGDERFLYIEEVL